MSLLSLHIIAAVASLLFMLGAFILGALFLFHEKRMREKRWGAWMVYLPSLLLNEQTALIWLRLGFFLLTFVLLTGSMLLGRGTPVSVWQGVHIFLAFASWMIYAVVLNRRWVGSRGRRILLLSFLGFASLSLLFLWK